MGPHDYCHTSMLPLRLLDLARTAVGRLSRPADDCGNPVLTVDALWLLPRCADASLHPYASGLLCCTTLARALADQLSWSTGNDGIFSRSSSPLAALSEK